MFLFYRTGGTVNFVWRRVWAETSELEMLAAKVRRMGYPTTIAWAAPMTFEAPSEPAPEWSGSPDPDDPDNYWIDDATGERVNATSGERFAPSPTGWGAPEPRRFYATET